MPGREAYLPGKGTIPSTAFLVPDLRLPCLPPHQGFRFLLLIASSWRVLASPVVVCGKDLAIRKYGTKGLSCSLLPLFSEAPGLMASSGYFLFTGALYGAGIFARGWCMVVLVVPNQKPVRQAPCCNVAGTRPRALKSCSGSEQGSRMLLAQHRDT